MTTTVNCKIKRQQRKNTNETATYKKITSFEGNFYDCLDNLIESKIPYNCETLLDPIEHQWYYIDNFSEQSFAIDIVNRSINNPDFESITKSETPRIEYFFIYESELIFFQKYRKSNHITKKWIWEIGETFKVSAREGWTINPIPDAIYEPATDILFFKKLEAITSIFKGIEELYKEATDQEVKDFLEQDFIQVKEGFGVAKVKKMNRKRIALVKERFDSLSPDKKTQLIKYVGEYCPEIKTNDGAIAIEDDQDLKNLLYGLDQRFYTTPIDDEKRLANSIIRLDK